MRIQIILCSISSNGRIHCEQRTQNNSAIEHAERSKLNQSLFTLGITELDYIEVVNQSIITKY